MFTSIRKNVTNMMGWSTKRRLIVLEFDDWGSIRIRSKKDYSTMMSKGLRVDKSHFTKNDSLESNDDLERLFELLSSHKDFKGSNAVFTPLSVVANPNFELIEESSFDDYYFESFTETCKKYPNHNRVHELWLKGIDENNSVSQFHRREDDNVKLWLDF